MLTKTPLAGRKDEWIEKWIRQTPAAQSAGRLTLPSLGKPQATPRGKARTVGVVSPFRRRVVVVAYYYRMKGQGYAKLHGHLNYVERPGAGELAVTPTLFDARSDAVEGHIAIKDWRDDRHHFRVLLAPNDGASLDMKAYTREYMAEVEKELGVKISWMAGIHEKADAAHETNRHAHIVIRGIDHKGADLVLSRNFIKQEMRRIAEELATKHLGQMSQRELEAFRSRQAERQREGQENYHSGRRPKARSQAQGIER